MKTHGPLRELGALVEESMRRIVLCHPTDAEHVTRALGQWPGIRPYVKPSDDVEAGTVVVVPAMPGGLVQVDVARLSADLDTAASSVHTPTAGDADRLRMLAAEVSRFADIIDGTNPKGWLVPFPWS